MDNLVFMRNCKDKEFDVAVVDPEYLNQEENMKDEDKRGGRMVKSGASFSDFSGKPTEEYFYHLFRISKEQIIFGGNYFTDLLDFSRFKSDGIVKPFLTSNNNWFIWYKQVADAKWSMCEQVWVSIKKPSKVFRYFPKGNVSNWHPTSKPVEVYRYIFETYLNKLKGNGRLSVLDTNLGSGSIRKVAFMLGYDFTGIEINRKFYDLGNADFDDYIAKNLLMLPYELEESWL
jgi:site-specific DNA-methyltransferase (adenine-specific)